MVKMLRANLTNALPFRYTEQKINAGVYEITMPLVHKVEDRFSIIKPLSLEKATPLKAAEHAELWIKRVQKLLSKDLVVPDKALFTLERANKAIFDPVYEDVLGEIENLGVKALDFSNINPVIDYVKKMNASDDVVH